MEISVQMNGSNDNGNSIPYFAPGRLLKDAVKKYRFVALHFGSLYDKDLDISNILPPNSITFSESQMIEYFKLMSSSNSTSISSRNDIPEIKALTVSKSEQGSHRKLLFN
ncbi:hypothetical protein CEXT_436711 [Caerostris extrusa]|uniref:Uncharacterized protein n=1 Tax=Caerostris extrusa TaxID=172846 RepID=A0AAV4XW42_CAEEX|nr:hypothetical protein CEXT_436711 [Caerostris extrusa]